MKSYSSSKKLKINTDSDQEDYISQLPDSIISDILSRLPTEDVLKTNVFSRKWRYKWLLMRDIKIDDRGCGGIKFYNYVNMLLSRTDVQYAWLKTVSISCLGTYPGYLETWIDYTLKRNIESLTVIAPEHTRLDSMWYFSDWCKLICFRLCLSCTILIRSTPNLKSLTLESGSQHGNLKLKTIPKVGLSFPVLEQLTLVKCEWLDNSTVEIYAPKLSSLRISCLAEYKVHKLDITRGRNKLFQAHFGTFNNFNLDTRSVTSLGLFHGIEDGIEEAETFRSVQILIYRIPRPEHLNQIFKPWMDRQSDRTFKVTSGDTLYNTAKKYEDLNLSAELLNNLYVVMKFDKPCEMQAVALPMIMTHPYKNLVAQASGPGKTACFMLGMLSRVDPKLMAPQALCISSTWPLAVKNLEVLEQMAMGTGITSALDIQPVPSNSVPSPITAQIVIGTLGTMSKLGSLLTTELGRSQMKILVLDDAHIFTKCDIEDFFVNMKKYISPSCQVLLFSATFDDAFRADVSEITGERYFNQMFVRKGEAFVGKNTRLKT